MPRSPRPELFRCHLRALRRAAGWTQAELARRVGLSRQSLVRIEAGEFLPNTAVSLRLAEALACRVEQLFSLDEAAVEPIVLPESGAGTSGRVLLARVGERLVGYPADPSVPCLSGYAPADALIRPGAPPDLLVSRETLERTAVVLGCDPALNLLREHLPRRAGGLRMHSVAASSRTSLDALAAGRAHVAGTHMVTPRGEPDLRGARRALAGGGGRVITFARWEQGLVLAPGNPREIRSLEDLTRPGVRLVNRPPGAGSRHLLDARLEEAGVSPEVLEGYGREVGSHAEVCQAVLMGSADAGVAVASLAVLCGLDFLPLGEVRFDLVVRSDALGHPAVQALLELLGEGRFLRELGGLPSYQVAATGEVVDRIPAAA